MTTIGFVTPKTTVETGNIEPKMEQKKKQDRGPEVLYWEQALRVYSLNRELRLARKFLDKGLINKGQYQQEAEALFEAQSRLMDLMESLAYLGEDRVGYLVQPRSGEEIIKKIDQIESEKMDTEITSAENISSPDTTLENQILETPAPVQEAKPVTPEMKVAPYSCILEQGDKVSAVYPEDDQTHDDWEIMNFSIDDGAATLRRNITKAGDSAVRYYFIRVGQEELYAKNQDLVVKLEPERKEKRKRGFETNNIKLSETRATQPDGSLETEKVSEDSLTLDQIEEQIKFINETGGLVAVGESGEFWEKKKREFLAREWAHKYAAAMIEVNEKIQRIEGGLASLDEKTNNEEESPEDKAIRESLTRNLEMLKKQRAELQIPFDETSRERLKRVYELAKVRGSGVWTKLKERVQHTVTAELWKYQQSEIVRAASEDVSLYLKQISEKLVRENILPGPESERAVNYAAKVFRESEIKEPTMQDFEDVFKMIKLRKHALNEKIVDDGLRLIESKITESLQNNFPDQTKETMATEIDTEKIKRELREELLKVSSRELNHDLDRYARIIRINLDQRWWARGIYGSLNPVLKKNRY